MNYAKAMPTPATVWKQSDRDAFLASSDGQEWMKQYRKDIESATRRNMAQEVREEVTEEVIKEYQLKLEKAEDKLAVINLILSIVIMEYSFKDNAEQNPNGWKHTHMNFETLVGYLLGNYNDPDVMKHIDEDVIRGYADELYRKYGKEIKFDSVDLNAEFGFNQYVREEDESIFDDMPAWQIYDLGFETATNTANLFPQWLSQNTACRTKSPNTFLRTWSTR